MSGSLAPHRAPPRAPARTTSRARSRPGSTCSRLQNSGRPLRSPARCSADSERWARPSPGCG
eukprot:6048274-Pleurochrysis_carterae.AAC.1